MRSDTISDILRRIAATRDERGHTRSLVAAGDWRKADNDTTRCVAFDARVRRESGLAEAVRGTNDFQPAAFLPQGATARRAVGRVLLQTPASSLSGTGFLISPTLFITNQHVLADAQAASQATVIFDDELDEHGLPRPRTIFRLAPERCAVFSDEQDLDYAVVALGERVQGDATVDELGYCPISFTPDRHRKGMNVNIIQHPEGMPKTIAIRNNLLTARTDTRLLYETDTDFGSSGAPVYNDQWDVVALHHYGAPSAPAADTTQVNEGVRISSIYQDLQDRLPQLDVDAAALLNTALALWVDPVPATGKQLERRTPVAALAAEAQVLPATAPKTLKRLPERAIVDTDYSNRNGFDGKFVPGLKLDLAKIAAPRQAVIAPLRADAAAAGTSAGERAKASSKTSTKAASKASAAKTAKAIGKATTSGELRYENFSILMHKARRFALLTATNIDGATWLSIDRKTGQPAAEQPEGDVWYNDPRIDPSYTVGQTFYSGWSNLFDRGHLTRREDPNWGEFATRANADTFHFTNCTPQHWKFNESIEYWQGIERYVLEKGIFDSGKDKPVTVLQGPVYDDVNDQWADDVQIPSAFWKVVAWKGAAGLKAVAMIADQTALLTLQRHGGSAPPPRDTTVSVLQFRASIATIESKTGLDLSALRKYDTAGGDLPVVGEALLPITRWEDIPLE
ncbi:DNA/RNA non-specific endonuclease [Bordetella sp. N]|uniref:DNA/RNA non-specific endonuclease n=1 Tax=Bordetella sp. N TaxID=1746199 RepID=UPI0007096895|nr:DNA/RNA non-specific endonuclease [Bordetella sp. N]ALM84542.1 hypothetical protein ASB57_17565 [Bordetella sp. N]